MKFARITRNDGSQCARNCAVEMISWLREHGFRLHEVYNTEYDRDGRAIQADFLFAR